MITQTELQELLHYDPATGHFTWKDAGNHKNKRVGLRAGWPNAGYWEITVKRKHFYAHRLAWLYVHGVWPKLDIDHIDGNKSNNAISNLRLATRSQNLANKPAGKGNKLGIKGVDLNKGRYRAQIKVGGIKYYLGRFDTPEEAGAAYAKAATLHFGEYANSSPSGETSNG